MNRADTATLLGFEIGWPGWVVVCLFLILWAALTYLVFKAARGLLQRLAARSEKRIATHVLQALLLPLIVLFALLGALILLGSSAFTAEVQGYGYFTLKTLAVITLVMALIRILTAAMFEMGASKASFRPLAGPTRFVFNLFVVIVGAILWMEAVGIPVTPVVATFGVVGLATGLALWDTLTNLFAGIYVIMDRRIRVGDYLRLHGAEEGVVESIGWRSTRLVNTSNDLVIVPNRRLAESIVVNSSRPQSGTIALVEVPVDSSADPEQVMAALREELGVAVKAMPGTVPEQIPLVRLAELAPTGLKFHVGVGVADVLDRMNVQSELRKRALECLRRAGIPPWGRPEEARADGDGARTRKKKSD
jgi:small-conductance mechanosensitive channel